MNKYNTSKIYKIVCNITNLVYYGSTTEKYLSSRLAKHKYSNNNCEHHSASNIVMHNNNYELIVVEECVFETKQQLLERERFYIENNECVNKNIPSKTQRERLTEWRQKNNVLVVCECGKQIKKSDMSRHKSQSKYHKQYENLLIKL